MQRLAGKVALITGAGRGIGRGIALCLAEEGADIVINDLPPKETPRQESTSIDNATETAQAVEALGRQALVHYADVSNRQQLAQLFTAAVNRFGHVDIAVANAAVTIRELVVEAHWENVLRTLEVSQFGVFHTCQMAAQQMIAQQSAGRAGGKRAGGKIIIISSVRAVAPHAASAAYNMAKAAVTQLGRTLAVEMAPYHINVNVIYPGWIDTPGEHELFTAEELREEAKRILWGRMGTPRDIGRAAAYLASADADYVTGTVLTVDGGFLLGLRDSDD